MDARIAAICQLIAAVMFTTSVYRFVDYWFPKPVYQTQTRVLNDLPYNSQLIESPPYCKGETPEQYLMRNLTLSTRSPSAVFWVEIVTNGYLCSTGNLHVAVVTGSKAAEVHNQGINVCQPEVGFIPNHVLFVVPNPSAIKLRVQGLSRRFCRVPEKHPIIINVTSVESQDLRNLLEAKTNIYPDQNKLLVINQTTCCNFNLGSPEDMETFDSLMNNAKTSPNHAPWDTYDKAIVLPTFIEQSYMTLAFRDRQFTVGLMAFVIVTMTFGIVITMQVNSYLDSEDQDSGEDE